MVLWLTLSKQSTPEREQIYTSKWSNMAKLCFCVIYNVIISQFDLVVSSHTGQWQKSRGHYNRTTHNTLFPKHPVFHFAPLCSILPWLTILGKMAFILKWSQVLTLAAIKGFIDCSGVNLATCNAFITPYLMAWKHQLVHTHLAQGQAPVLPIQFHINPLPYTC